MAEPKELVRFSVEQVKWLREMYPHQIMSPKSTPEEMHRYFGAQSVVSAIEARIQR